MPNPQSNAPLRRRVLTTCACSAVDQLVVEKFTGILLKPVPVGDNLVILRNDFRVTDVMTRCRQCRVLAPLRFETEPSPAREAVDLGTHMIKDEKGVEIEIQVFRDPVSRGVFAVESEFLDQVTSVINSPFDTDTLLSLPEPKPGSTDVHIPA